jgi:hypothetical protein
VTDELAILHGDELTLGGRLFARSAGAEQDKAQQPQDSMLCHIDI